MANPHLHPPKKVIVTPETVRSITRHLAQFKEFGFDTETTGLSRKDRLFSIIVACSDGAYYFNYKNYQDASPFLLKQNIPLHFQNLFDTADRIYIHNAKFDMFMAAMEGIKFSRDNVTCVQVQARLKRNNLLNYSLAALARGMGLEKDSSVEEYITAHKLYTKVSVPGKKTSVTIPHFDKVPFPVISEYGCQDAWLHYKLGENFDQFLSSCPDRRLVYANEQALTRVCFDIERRGIGIDWQYVVNARDWELQECSRAQREFEVLSKEPYMGTKAQLIRLFTEAGEKIPVTEKNNPSLTGDVLDTFTSPIAQIEKRIRGHEQRIATYYSSFLHFVDSDSRIHPNMRQAGTETGRFSYSSPNLQNLPKEEDSTAPFVVRGSFIPAVDCTWACFDYSQVEYRLMLDYAGEHYLIKEILAGADVHQAMADLVGITRNQAKTLNFAILYGSGVMNIASMLGITLREAKELRAQYFGRLPKVGAFIEQVTRVAKSRGYVKNWLGRYCYLPHYTMAYKMPNHLIQGGAADVIKKAMVEMRGEFEGMRSGTCLQVHDELDIEIHRDETDLIEKIRQHMEAAYIPMNGMRLKVDVAISKGSLAKRELQGFGHAS